MIRPATRADVGRITAIWNQAIAETTATFTTVLKTEAEIATALNARVFLVAEAEVNRGGIAGFATYGPFRSGPGYAGVVEHSIYVAPDAQGAGWGRALLEALIETARGQGDRMMVGALCGENAAARALHLRCGFVQTADMPDMGRKFGRSLNLLLMQKNLASTD